MNPLFLGPIFDIAGKIFDRVIPDKAAAEKAKAEFAATAQSQEFQLALGQIQVNLEEAKNPSLFVSGWRPFVGWVCAGALAYAAVLEPVGRFIAVVGFSYGGKFPVIDTMLTLQVILGLLGLGGLRSFEKSKGVASK